MHKKLPLLLFIACLSISCHEEDFLHGYSNEQVFASPTQQELDAVINDWKSRDLSPQNHSVVQSVEVFPNISLKIVSYSVNGQIEYGALLVPASNNSLPVHMFIGGFELTRTANSVKLEVDDTFFDDAFIFAFPALRGQSLSVTVNGKEYVSPISEGVHCEAFDGATDDALAFLNVIEKTEATADMSRVAVRGGSRGGTVALLMAERDKRVKLVIGVAGPTNMIELTARFVKGSTPQCQFLEELESGSTLIAVRQKMIASSPVFFAKDLPNTQLHYAANDSNVPVSQGEELKTTIDHLGLGIPFEMFIYKGRDHSTIADGNAEMNDRIARFMKQL